MKRKTFKGLLLRNLAIAMVLALLLLAAIGIIARSLLIAKVKDGYVNMHNHYVEYFQLKYYLAQRGKDNLSEEEIKSIVYDYMSKETSIIFEDVPVDNILFSSMAIYELENEELIAGTEKRAWIEMREEYTNFGKIIFCHPSTMDKLEGYGSTMNYPIVKDYYVKDNKYYLGIIGLSNYKDGEVIDTLDVTPKNVGEYKRVEVLDTEEYFFYDLNIYGPEESNADYLELQEYIKRTGFSGNSDGFEYEMDGFNIFITGHNIFRLPDGERYIMFGSSNVNLYMYYKAWIILTIIGIPLVAISIGVLLAFVKYTKLKAQYTMEDYRRTLTDSMAHDLKSPLMAISGYAENLKENINTDKKEHYAEAIVTNVSYMNDIITNVLELSKLEAGSITLKKKDINLSLLIKKCQEKYETLIEEKNLKIECGNLPNVKGDESLLMQAFDNLLSNAVKYSEPYTSIEIKSEADRIIVSNSCSLSKDLRPDDLWKPFVKGDNARSNKTGTGIGLTIAKNIFEMHGFKQKILYVDGKFIVEISGKV